VYEYRVRYLIRKTRELEATVLQRTAEVRAALLAAETAREQLRDQAMRDSLTGFWNRRAIFELLDGEIARCQRASRPLCVLMADLDHFKSINDTWGHLGGDAVLHEVSKCIRQGLRRFEAVGRYGGEEFVILLSECSLSTALKRAEDLRANIQELKIEIGGHQIGITCSFGVAEHQSCNTGEDLISRADASLYVAKRKGRNCVWTQ